MRRQVLISLLVSLTMQTVATAVVRPVPLQYPTIQDAINASVNGDVVVVAPEVYTGPGNRDLDFGGKIITVQSEINPNNPDPAIIASTIIDCQGNKYVPHRAFYFHNSEGPDSKVLGFTIRNGYARGPKGADGNIAGEPIDEEDEDSPPRANSGQDTTGDGYGGAILCAGTSPTIQYCVITHCTVTGGQGGDGAPGQSGTWTYQPPDPDAVPVDVTDGQWGGHGGKGTGYGYGGAIACINGSSPIISNCTIKDNIARGSRGGDGGNGGNAAGEFPDYDEGSQGGSGSGGDAEGDGIGGGLYADYGSSPVITNCDFRNDIATQALGGAPGVLGLGNVDTDPPQPLDGVTGQVTTWGGIAGGAAYYGVNSNPDFTDCTFESNKAYEVIFGGISGPDVLVYTRGGALFSDAGNTIDLNNCQFTLNLGGAVYCQNNNVLNFDGCLFRNNSDTNNGGAIYVSPGGTVNLQNCNLTGNSARYDGGALNCKGNAYITNCFFGGNRALGGDGGGIEAYRPGTTLTLDFEGCTFGGNDAIWGGGVHIQEFDSTFTDCYFVGNTAEIGAGLLLSDGTVSVSGGAINSNYAYGAFGIGGGLACINTAAEISNCAITDNLADGANASGGGITFYGGFLTHVVKNCLITGNYATVSGGAISCELFATPQFENCTFSDNTAGSLGGAIFSDWGSDAQITDCIFENCNSHAVCKEDYGGTVITNSLFDGNPDGDYGIWDSLTGLTDTYIGADELNAITGNMNNIDGDPRFVTGPLGDYYLNQSDSPAVDAGSDTAVNLGMNVYTTATNDANDTGQVDMGYHYPKSGDIAQYQLTVTVAGGHGTAEATDPEPVDYDPVSGIYTYRGGTIVTLAAHPDAGWRIKQWAGGTVDDTSTSSINLVIMTSDKNITIECEKGRTLEVGPNLDYANIQSAIYDADDGDTIVVDTGTWFRPEGGYYVNKSIVITSKYPDNPACVAATIIDGSSSGGSEWYFGPDTDEGTILNGFTIENSNWFTLWDDWPGDRAEDHPDGYDGGCSEGGLIYIYSGGGPIIKNCVIRNSIIRGGIGGDGVNATDTENAGRGGWGGWSRGGAIYCEPYSGPTFINCKITDNEAIGGNGGDGGDFALDGGEANYGGNWSKAESWNYDPFNLDIIWVPGDLWEVWPWEYAWYYYYVGLGNGFSYIGDYRWHSGYGGGVYCDEGSTVTFTDCTISGNLAQGGMSGIGGLGLSTQQPPLISYEIPSFGGGVYCAADSEVTFTGCTLTDNVSSEPTFDHSFYDDGLPPGYDPVNTYRLDPYLGHGAGVCAERSATVVFNNCLVGSNDAAVGGGLYWTHTTLTISDCDFVNNTALLGGAMASMEGSGTIIGTTIANNNAAFTDEEGLGDGGGVHLWGTDAQLLDCFITGNQAGGSGGGVYFGGVYFGGDGYESFSLKLHNCLVTDNTSVFNGGGVSCNWYSEPNIINCTISDNITEDPAQGDGRGGGLYCSYYTNANVINSILWDNTADNGNQMAIGSGDPPGPAPSTVTVSYSDIQDGQSGVEVDPGCTLNWLEGNIDDDPLFVTGPLALTFSDSSMGPSYYSYSSSGAGLSESAAAAGNEVAGAILVEGKTIRDRFAAGQDRVKVIVSLRKPLEVSQATGKKSPKSRATLKAEIASRQSAVLSTFTSAELSLRHRYENQAAFSGEVTRNGLDKLLNNPLVTAVEPVRYLKPALAQAIPLANALAVRQTYNGQGVAVAIVDSGVDYTHPRLGGGGFPNDKVIGGYDFGDDDFDPIPGGTTDATAHGTCCAGIVAGDLGTIGDYIGGVAYGAKIFALKATPDDSDLAATDDAIAAWDWCITHKNDDPANPIVVISYSYGSIESYTSPSAAEAANPAEAAMANNVVAAGITLLASSGNEFQIDALSAPAAFSSVISVGAVDDVLDTVMDYSNTAYFLDILAPADPVYTTDIVGTDGYDAGDYYPYFNGTSSACPFAAGAVAILQSAAFEDQGTYLTPAAIRELLISTGDPVTDTKVAITKPRVNVGAAVVEFGAVPLGDYYLSQILAGQDVDSPCVNAGKHLAVDIGLNTYTTRTDHVPDDYDGIDPSSAIVDMGYHYPLMEIPEPEPELEPCRVCDLAYDGDGIIDSRDLAVLASRWLNQGCATLDWCAGADLTFDTRVDFEDFAFFAGCWLVEDSIPPDRAEWEIQPYSTSATAPYEITMTAREAYDTWNGNVQYKFWCTSHDYYREWQDGDEGRTWVDTNLAHGEYYTYRVKTRDKSPNQNESAWSEEAGATTGEDSNPPGPVGWEVPPEVTGPGETSITMTAQVATDAEGNGVWYQFECTHIDGVPVGIITEWQQGRTWTHIGLTAGVTYTYVVRTRDDLWNISSDSAPASAVVEEPGDTEPPAPLGWEQMPYEYLDGQGYYHHYMSAQEAFDDSGVVLYYFESSYGVVPSSGWQEESFYDVLVSYTGSVPCCYKIGLRDLYGNTVWMPDEQAECTF